jgi:hypothetical protein
MILDKENMFSHGQMVSAHAMCSSDFTVDLGPGDAGPSERLSLFVAADPGITDMLRVDFQTSGAIDPDGNLDNPVTVASFEIGADALAAGGKLVACRLPHGCKRYARLQYSAGAAVNGPLTAGLVWDVQADAPAPTGPSGL